MPEKNLPPEPARSVGELTAAHVAHVHPHVYLTLRFTPLSDSMLVVLNGNVVAEVPSEREALGLLGTLGTLCLANCPEVSKAS